MATGIFEFGRKSVPLFDKTDMMDEGRGAEGVKETFGGGVASWYRRQKSQGRQRRFDNEQVQNIMLGPESPTPTVDRAMLDANAAGRTVVNPTRVAGGGYAFGSVPIGSSREVTAATAMEPTQSASAAAGSSVAAAEQDLDGDGIPDGAEVKRTVKAAGADGGETSTTAAWIHKAAAKPEMTARDRLTVFRGENSRDTGHMRQASEVRARYAMTDENQIAKENADRAAGIEKARVQGMGAAEAMGKAKGEIATMEGDIALDEISEKGRQFDVAEERKANEIMGVGGGGFVNKRTGESGYAGPPKKDPDALSVKEARSSKDKWLRFRGPADALGTGMLIDEYIDETYNDDGTLKEGATISRAMETALNELNKVTMIAEKRPHFERKVSAPTEKKPAAGTMVRIQAPDGTIATVPADQIEKYKAKGGKLI